MRPPNLSPLTFGFVVFDIVVVVVAAVVVVVVVVIYLFIYFIYVFIYYRTSLAFWDRVRLWVQNFPAFIFEKGLYFSK